MKKDPNKKSESDSIKMKRINRNRNNMEVMEIHMIKSNKPIRLPIFFVEIKKLRKSDEEKGEKRFLFSRQPDRVKGTGWSSSSGETKIRDPNYPTSMHGNGM